MILRDHRSKRSNRRIKTHLEIFLLLLAAHWYLNFWLNKISFSLKRIRPGFSANSEPWRSETSEWGQCIRSNNLVNGVLCKRRISVDCRAINPFCLGGNTPTVITNDTGSIWRFSSIKQGSEKEIKENIHFYKIWPCFLLIDQFLFVPRWTLQIYFPTVVRIM